MTTRKIRNLTLSSWLLLSLLGLLPGQGAKERITLASTTSTFDSGFFDVFIPVFEKKFDCNVKVIAVGTGQAMRLGRDGNADVLLVHDREAEDRFVADGFGLKRQDVMHNEFFIVGPKSDPAVIRGLKAVDAFKKIAAGGAVFVSRGDDSGTHKRELRLWAEAATKPVASKYIVSGSGMETTLRIADEKLVYTLVDQATWLSQKKKNDGLEVLVEGDSELFNPYSVIVVSPAKFPWLNFKLATKFAEFIRSAEGQTVIRDFGKDMFGEPLFFPDVVR